MRVPTHQDGSCLFWEFATDSYDIGFGVYFEWTISHSNAVSIHVSDSSDPDDDEEDEDDLDDAGKVFCVNDHTQFVLVSLSIQCVWVDWVLKF